MFLLRFSFQVMALELSPVFSILLTAFLKKYWQLNSPAALTFARYSSRHLPCATQTHRLSEVEEIYLLFTCDNRETQGIE